MKNNVKFLSIISVVVFVLVFNACVEPDSGDYGMVTVTRNSIKVSGETVNSNSSFITINGDYLYDLDNFSNPVCNIVNGILTINLGVPSRFYTYGFFQHVTVSDPSVRMYILNGFVNRSDEVYNEERNWYPWLNLGKFVSGNQYYLNFYYTDKAVNINGTWQSSETYTRHYNLSLQPGWNPVIRFVD